MKVVHNILCHRNSSATLPEWSPSYLPAYLSIAVVANALWSPCRTCPPPPSGREVQCMLRWSCGTHMRASRKSTKVLAVQ